MLTLCTLFVLPNNSYATSPEDRFLDQFFERCEPFLSRDKRQEMRKESQSIIDKFKVAIANTEELNKKRGIMFKKIIRISSLCTLFVLPNNSWAKSPEDCFLDQFFEEYGQLLSRGEFKKVIKEFKNASSNTKKLDEVISAISEICRQREGMMWGYSSFMDCEKWDHTKVEMEKCVRRAKYLIENKADIDTISGQNKSMLSVAAEANAPAFTQWLIAHGANVELVDGRGMTALFTAIAYNSPEVLEVLLQNKSNPTLTDNEKIALFFTYQLGYKEIAKLLSGYE